MKLYFISHTLIWITITCIVNIFISKVIGGASALDPSINIIFKYVY